MTRKKIKIFRLFAWVLGALIALVLLITLSFYLGRTWIMQRALAYMNENQHGEVHVAHINLLPLIDLPNSIVQFKDLSWYENPVRPPTLFTRSPSSICMN